MLRGWKRDGSVQSAQEKLGMLTRLSSHSGVLATKVRYFGVKSTNVYLVQMGTKPTKVAQRPSWPSAPRGRPKRLNQAFPPRSKTFLQKGLRSAGGPKLLKWGLPGRGVKSAKLPLPLAEDPRVFPPQT